MRAEQVRVLPTKSALVLELLQNLFLGGGRRGFVCDIHPVREPVHSKLGLVLDHGQVMPYDQVGDDFSLALELWRLGRKALALVKRGLDLATDPTNAGSGVWAERSSCPVKVTSLAHLASNCAQVAVEGTYGWV